jgi:hypothetical protein
VKKAKTSGVLPDCKFPTFHDLRHSHVASLLCDGHSLTYVQRRLGHESIKTTSDRYGHLLETAHTAALETLDRVVGATRADRKSMAVTGSLAAAVYVATLGQYAVAFASEGEAENVAERWVRERGGSVRVDKADEARTEGELRGTARRGWVWEAGPVAYASDGSGTVTDPSAVEVRGVVALGLRGLVRRGARASGDR